MRRKQIWTWSVVVLALGAGLALSATPWRAYFTQQALTDAQLNEMRTAEESRSALSREKARLENPVGREELAREQNYRRPGEQPADGG